MVFEQLYSSNWIEKKAGYAFLLGLSYSIIGIASAMFLFPQDPGIVAIAFTSLLITPSLNRLLTIEEKQAAKSSGFNIIDLYRNHSDIFKVYFFLFLGILLAFAFYAVVWPTIATTSVFEQQANIFGNVGNAIKARYNLRFIDLFANNLKVMIFCLVASLFYGSGAIFLITWNASVWGVIFGMIARNSALTAGSNPFLIFALTFIAVFPHMILEASTYFIAAISGGIISKAVVREKPFSERFNIIIQDGFVMFMIALIILVIAVYIETYITGHLIGMFGL